MLGEGDAPGVVDGGMAVGPPWIKLRPVRLGARHGTAVDGARPRIVVRRREVRAASIDLVGVIEPFGSAVALGAHEGAAHRKPQASLSACAELGAVLAGAWCAVLADTLGPVVGRLPILPLRELAVDGFPRLGLDQAVVSCRQRERLARAASFIVESRSSLTKARLVVGARAT